MRKKEEREKMEEENKRKIRKSRKRSRLNKTERRDEGITMHLRILDKRESFSHQKNMIFFSFFG